MVHVVFIATCVIALACDGSHFASAFLAPKCQIRSVASSRSSLQTYQSKNSITMTAEASIINEMSDFSQKSKSPIEKFFNRMPTKLQKFSKIAFPFLIQLSVMVLFSVVCPAFAKPAQKSFSKTASVTVKAPPLWKKILEGVNTSGAFKARKAGDTRTEFAAILNSISSLLILGAIFFGAFLRHLQRENYQSTMMRKELKKVDEYKENMYFEAVQDILSKINDPKTKGSAKASLQKQLKDLDPQGAIQKFLEGGDRPDISGIINRKSKPKGKKAAAAGDKSLKKKSPPQAPTSQSFNDDEEEDASAAAAAAAAKVPKISPQESKESPKDEIYLVMLGELYDGLEGVLPDDSRADVVEYLKQRIESISDPTKKASTVRKIAEKLGDDDYWVQYAAKLE